MGLEFTNVFPNKYWRQNVRNKCQKYRGLSSINTIFGFSYYTITSYKVFSITESLFESQIRQLGVRRKSRGQSKEILKVLTPSPSSPASSWRGYGGAQRPAEVERGERRRGEEEISSMKRGDITGEEEMWRHGRRK